MARTVSTVVAGLVVLTGTATPAGAHARLASSDPQEGQTLEAPPTTVTLTFNETINPQFVQVAAAEDGRSIGDLAVQVDGRTVSAAIPTTPTTAGVRAGAVGWLIDYRVVSDDGHPIEGELTFLAPVASPPVTDTGPTSSPLATDSSSGPAPSASRTGSTTDADSTPPPTAPRTTQVTATDSDGTFPWGGVVAALAVLLVAMLAVAWRQGRGPRR